ncbi:MAG: tRNA (guanosine(46)-N7)-methyltransferase TrmB [Clostridia bacterium]|nr:tRNA (guanosine(46)-N7)-methyltransferase TrmB [Clostridia bacterium]
MRMRKKRHFDERLERVSERLVKNPEELKGDWNRLFGNDNPIYIEIGSGKGRFISEMARLNPDVNFIAVDVIPDCILMALEKTAAVDYKNLRFIISDAAMLAECFADGEIDRIYLNFSDPWKKKKQAKRRLTHQNFLDVYKKFLKKGGSVCFKTDNRGLFEFSLNSFAADRDFMMSNILLDLHNSDFEGNVMTEYEQKFSEQGMPIYRLEARYSKDDI